MEAVVIAKQYGKSVIFREAKNQNGVPGFIGFIKMTYEDGDPNFRLVDKSLDKHLLITYSCQ